MRQIAERAQVSIGTVSHVINGIAKVREKLRRRVLEVIRSLGLPAETTWAGSTPQSGQHVGDDHS